MTRITCISDCHGQYPSLRQLPEGDILLDSGDWTAHDDERSIVAYLRWLESQPHRHKIFCAGNHQTWVEKNPDLFAALRTEFAPSCIYLNDSGTEVEGLKVWGSPITKTFMNWAFNRDEGADIRRHWDLIPSDTQVLITHGPPYGILDEVGGYNLFRTNARPEHVGSKDLLSTIQTRLKDLRLVCFGHCHGPGGQTVVKAGTPHGIVYVNASIVDEGYTYAHPPVEVNL